MKVGKQTNAQVCLEWSSFSLKGCEIELEFAFYR